MKTYPTITSRSYPWTNTIPKFWFVPLSRLYFNKLDFICINIDFHILFNTSLYQLMIKKLLVLFMIKIKQSWSISCINVSHLHACFGAFSFTWFFVGSMKSIFESSVSFKEYESHDQGCKLQAFPEFLLQYSHVKKGERCLESLSMPYINCR